MKRKMLAIFLVVAIVSLAGCKPNGNSNSIPTDPVDKLFVGLHIALASSGSLLVLLVSSGKLSQQKADWIAADFRDEVTVADNLRSDVVAATDLAGRLAAAQTAYHESRLIYERGHYGLDPTVQMAANIADGIFAAFVALFGGRVASNAVRTAAPASEADQRAAIETQIEVLKQTLAVK